jgi:hypothetical protein
MNTGPNGDGQTDYIRRRIKRALTFQALRELRKNVARMEAEEAAERRAETKIVLGIWVAIFSVICSLFMYKIINPPPAKIEYSTTITTGRITSWNAKKSTAMIKLKSGGKIKCSRGAHGNCAIGNSLPRRKLKTGVDLVILQFTSFELDETWFVILSVVPWKIHNLSKDGNLANRDVYQAP